MYRSKPETSLHFNIIIFMFYKWKWPVMFDMFRKTSNIHHYYTRQSNKLYVQYYCPV